MAGMVVRIYVHDAFTITVASGRRRHPPDIDHVHITNLPLSDGWRWKHKRLVEPLWKVMANRIVVILTRQRDYFLTSQGLRVKQGNPAVEPRHLGIILG